MIIAELLNLLLLIIVANGAPILARVALKDKFDLAIDFGLYFPDNKPIFGHSKTWRGVIAAILVTCFTAWFLGYSPVTGILVAIYAVLGDLLSSFIKRRLAMPPSSMAHLLDQIPESLLPVFFMKETFQLDIYSVILLVILFIVIELTFSQVLYKWGIRQRTY